MAMDSISRLAEQFRADVHAAKTAEIAKADGDALPASFESTEKKSEPERQMLTLMQPDQKEVQYRFDGNRITRLVRSGDQITQRETFALPEHCQVQWQLNDFVDAGASTGGRPYS